MKKFLFAVIAGSFSTLAITNGAIAQTSSKMKVFNSTESDVTIHKLIPAMEETTNPVNTNAKALNNFKKTYKDAAGVKWITSNKVIIANFVSDGIQTAVYYDTKGHWHGSLKNYMDEKFNPKVRALVKSNYYDYKITNVQEIETIDTYGVPTYLAFIEDDTNFKVIRVSDGLMDVYQQFKKQN
ncbi:MAG: hypothetical protein ABI691_21700 [Ginsengibacter sp.]